MKTALFKESLFTKKWGQENHEIVQEIRASSTQPIILRLEGLEYKVVTRLKRGERSIDSEP